MKFKGRGLLQITGKQTNAVAYQRLWKDIWIAENSITNLILSEGTVYGSRYYCVEPVGGNWRVMEAWCYNTFGESGDVWDKFPKPKARWYMNNRKFWFREDKDRTMFILRWS